MSNEDNTLFAGSSPAMRTNSLEVVGTGDFIGDFLLSAFIGNFKFSRPDITTITNHEQKMAFGLEWRLERVECATSSASSGWLLEFPAHRILKIICSVLGLCGALLLK